MSSVTATNQNGKRSATFRDAIMSDLANPTTRLGENGCPEYTDKGLGSKILALSQLVRGGDPSALCQEVLSENSTQDVCDLMTLLFVTRNTRGGKGEKDLSYKMFFEIWLQYPATAKKLLALFPHYGYWKDLFLLVEMASTLPDGGDKLKEDILAESIVITRAQLETDIAALQKYKAQLAATSEDGSVKRKGPQISLLAKWMPRENSHFDKSLKFVSRFTQTPPSSDDEGWKSKNKAQYRKSIGELTSYLELPEVLLSAQRADEINFAKLASKATFKLSRALLNEDKQGQTRSEDPKRIRLAEMFTEHLVKNGLKGGQLMPHEIVAEILKGNVSPMREKVLDAQWKDLWKNVVQEVKAKAEKEGLEFNPTRMTPLSDVSGSMFGDPMLVSIALGIGISEITHPAFQNMVMTFESNPRWHILNVGDSIVKKVQSLSSAPWGGSTNFEKAYGLILDVACKHHLAKEDVPSLIVFSDMQFNEASSGHQSDTMLQVMKVKTAGVAQKLGWEDADLPPIVFWNLRNTGGHPVEKDTAGTVLLSGFSPSLLKMVMNGDALKEEEVQVVDKDGTVRTEKVRITPEEMVRKMLDDSIYDPVRVILGESQEKALGDYELLEEVTGASPDEDFEVIL